VLRPLPAAGGSAALIVLLAVIGLLNSLGSDLLIPALPALRADLGIGECAAQQTIACFFAASAAMSLWYGAIADACGRRRTLLAALLLLSASALASPLVTGIEQLWLLRTLQGIGAGAGMVISRAVLNDLHQGASAQHLLGRITLLQTLSLLVTPVVGAWLAAHWGWRSVLASLGWATALLVLACWHWLPETLPPAARTPLHPRRLLGAYRGVLANGRFLRLSIAHVANWTSMAVYTVSAPTIVIAHLGRSATEVYLVYAPITLGLVGGFLAFPLLRKCFGIGRLLGIAYTMLGSALLANLAFALLLPGQPIGLAPLAVYSFGLALALPPLLGQALEAVRRDTGVAASLQTFLQFAMIAVAASLLAPWWSSSPIALATGISLLTLAGALLLYPARRQLAD